MRFAKRQKDRLQSLSADFVELELVLTCGLFEAVFDVALRRPADLDRETYDGPDGLWQKLESLHLSESDLR